MQPRGAEDCDLPKCRKPNGIPYSSGKIISELSSIIQKIKCCYFLEKIYKDINFCAMLLKTIFSYKFRESLKSTYVLG